MFYQQLIQRSHLGFRLKFSLNLSKKNNRRRLLFFTKKFWKTSANVNLSFIFFMHFVMDCNYILNHENSSITTSFPFCKNGELFFCFTFIPSRKKNLWNKDPQNIVGVGMKVFILWHTESRIVSELCWLRIKTNELFGEDTIIPNQDTAMKIWIKIWSHQHSK